jgi:hypothetical protein
MTFNASKFEVQERQLSDVEAVQAPVQDNSKAMGMAGIAKGVGEFAQSAFQVKDKWDRDKKAELEAQGTVFSNRYDAAIEKYSGAVASGEMSQQQATTYLGVVKDELVTMGASADDLNKTEIASLKTLSGRALTEETPEEAAEKARYGAFAGSRFWEYGASKEKQDDNRRAYELSFTKNLGYEQDIEEAQYQVQMAAGDEAKKKRAERALATAMKKQMNNLQKDLPLTFSNQVKGLEEEVEAVRARDGEAAAATAFKNGVDRLRNTHLNHFSNIAAQTQSGLPAQYDLAKETVNRIADVAIKYTGSAEYAKELEAELRSTTTKAKVAALEDIDTLSSHVIESLIPGSGNLMQDDVTDRIQSAKGLIKNSQSRSDGDPVLDLSPETEAGAANLELTLSMLSNVGKVKSSGEPKVDVEVVGNSVSSYLAYLGDLSDKSNLKDLRSVVSILSEPDFARFVREHPEELGAKDLANAQQSLTAYQEKVGQSTFNLLSQVVSAEERSQHFGQGASAHAKVIKHQEPTEEGLDIKFVNGQVVVVATARGSRELAKQLTEKVNQPLTEAINASAALSKQSAESIFNDWLPQLWPSKYGEEPAQEEQGSQSGDVADDPNKGKTFRHKVTGKLYTVGADGVPVEVR